MIERVLVMVDEYYMDEVENIAQSAIDLGMEVEPQKEFNTFWGQFEVDNLDTLFGIEGVVFVCPERSLGDLKSEVSDA